MKEWQIGVTATVGWFLTALILGCASTQPEVTPLTVYQDCMIELRQTPEWNAVFEKPLKPDWEKRARELDRVAKEQCNDEARGYQQDMAMDDARRRDRMIFWALGTQYINQLGIGRTY